MGLSNATKCDLSVLDLAGLREITGGDAALEQALFAEFIRSGEEFIATLAQSLAEEHAEQWRKTAHAFKGTSLNLGAEMLAEYCKEAQEKHEASSSVKSELLARIRDAFTRVVPCLQAPPPNG